MNLLKTQGELAKKLGWALTAFLCAGLLFSCKAEVMSASPMESDTGAKLEPELVTYTVTFDPNGGEFTGSETGVRTAEAGKTVSFPAAPTLDGYTLAGWFDAPHERLDWDGTPPSSGRFAVNTKINADVTMYALWKAVPVDSYTITFLQYEGGDIVQTGYVYPKDYYKYTQSLPPVGVREHYSSDGAWWTAAQDGELFDPAVPVMENITLYAHWLPETYDIYYWRNDERGIYSKNTVSFPVTEVLLPLVPSRDGYAFQGWYTEKLNDLRHDLVYNDPTPTENRFTPQSPVSGDMHIWALWKVVPPDAYIVTYLAYDNYVLQTDAARFADGYKVASAPPPVPARAHYTCDGKWYTSDGQEFTANTVLSANTTVSPQWVGNRYTVRFMENNVDETVWQTREIQYPVNTLGSAFPQTAPNRPHYSADEHWWTQKAGGSVFNAGTVITGNIAVYKHWVGSAYTVRFLGATDSSPQQPVDLVPARTARYPLDSLNPPTIALPGVHEIAARGHYTFSGLWWTAAAGGSVWAASAPVTADTTLYIHWTPNTYTVVFNGNGGSPASSSASVTYPASAVPLPAYPVRNNYVFAGWTYTKAGKTKTFTGGGVDSNLTVTAKWVAKDNAQTILNEYDNSAAETNDKMTSGGAYQDDFVVGSGDYTGPLQGADAARELKEKLELASQLRQGTTTTQTVQVEGGSQTITITEYDYAALNLVKQEIEDLLENNPAIRGTFAATEHSLNYTGSRQSVTVMNGGVYEIELWGASGGHIWSKNDKTALGGRGGYTKGRVRLNAGDVLKFYVGQEGFGTARYNGGSFQKITNFSAEGAGVGYQSGHKGGWNGGGKGGASYGGDYAGGSGGGGATDVRFVGTYSANKNDAGTFAQRIMAAAGGGGAAQSASYNGGWPGLAGGNAGANGIRKGNVQTGGARAGGLSALAALDLTGGVKTSGSKLGDGGNAANGSSGAAYEGPGGGGGGYYGGESIATTPSTEFTSSGAGGSSWIDASRFTGDAWRVIDLNSSLGNGRAKIKYVSN
ncbi:MAG: InlB B-repeat-containing protein [Spirochaetaceae bacterium]|jgi:uncharacterized repeat protein (TIGR02543 family)|nr:InlB B-repeat-containing protein [Spirochaetaceae bacterium]